MMVCGPAATALGELVRERWNRAVQNEAVPRQPPPVRAPPAIFWPGHVKPDLLDVQVAIARTRPAYKDQIEVREIE
jgi:phosphatidylserine/phosphatidylglycerophosphate/cardiolipin synthase-like enzyme